MTGLTPQGEALLREGAAQLDVALTEEQVETFRKLYQLLQEGNARSNLTALKTQDDIVLKHFVDSLSCLRGNHLDGSARMLDLGTGGGFPSLPLAIVRPQLHIVPMDATRKKIDFVRETALTLGLSNVEPVTSRAEILGRERAYRAQFDRVVARAVTALPILVELAVPFLRVGGLLVSQKGELTREELNAGAQAAELLGGQVREVDEFKLPLRGDARTIVVVEKIRTTPEQYPRRDGLPNQQPLFWKAKG